jgi:hypothetical protein
MILVYQTKTDALASNKICITYRYSMIPITTKVIATIHKQYSIINGFSLFSMAYHRKISVNKS